jgi:hypothetical protein
MMAATITDLNEFRRGRAARQEPEQPDMSDPVTRFEFHRSQTDILLRKLWPDYYPQSPEGDPGDLLDECERISERVCRPEK